MAIRSEKDKNIIKHFSKDQRRIYDEWQERTIAHMDEAAFERDMAGLEKMFAALCGGGEGSKR